MQMQFIIHKKNAIFLHNDQRIAVAETRWHGSLIDTTNKTMA
jgi:hypothetical protein